jgi:hypothetical protein
MCPDSLRQILFAHGVVGRQDVNECGYTIDEPWVIVLALAHNCERLKEVPSNETTGVGATNVGDHCRSF